MGTVFYVIIQSESEFVFAAMTLLDEYELQHF